MRDVFLFGVAIHYTYLAIIVWSIVRPDNRIWPPTEKRSWRYVVSWGLFSLAVGVDLVIAVWDRDSRLSVGKGRYYLGVPLIVIGGLLLAWGVSVLGLRNTSGVAGWFVVDGPYKFTRNPQYVGDILLFLGLAVVSNSLYADVGFMLLILAFVLMPVAEELWLEEMYGEKYEEYRVSVPRFL